MKSFIVLAVMAAFVLPVIAGPTVVNFDDLATNQTLYGMDYDLIPQEYQGMQWLPHGDGWNVNSSATYKSAYLNSYGAVSGSNFASNSGVQIASVLGDTFDFAGAEFSTWAYKNGFASYSARSVTAKGYLGDTLIGNVTMDLSSQGFNWLAADFEGIDRLELTTTTNGGYWIMDDFTYTVSAVPTPSAILLGGMGMSLVGWLRRRKQL